ncbi:hypothetical protein [Ktedonospora formicarum]|uniref:hypothetical protein n=1 Tax=Ktedonospora formicarum TaxID=2778364 RepID=UPI001C68A9AE|nr:hypothetical protein [Ktedonospora formicarum]
MVYLLLAVLALLIYGWFALFLTRRGTTDERVALHQGLVWGLLCGGAWAIELLVANLPLVPSKQLTFVLYESMAWLGFLLPMLPSLLAGWQTKRIGPGLQAGVLCGMLGGLIIFFTWLLFSALLFQAGLRDPQTIAEFRHSGLSDITTYMISDWLAALIGHLWIGLITGLLLGILGGAVGKGVRWVKKTSDETN